MAAKAARSGLDIVRGAKKQPGEVARLVSLFMQDAGVSERDLAKRVGVSPPVIHHLRTGWNQDNKPYLGLRVRSYKDGEPPLLFRVAAELGIDERTLNAAINADRRRPITYLPKSRNYMPVRETRKPTFGKLNNARDYTPRKPSSVKAG